MRSFLPLCCLALTLNGAQQAHADWVLSMNDIQFSGPAYTGSFTVTFQDIAPGTVRVTIANNTGTLANPLGYFVQTTGGGNNVAIGLNLADAFANATTTWAQVVGSTALATFVDIDKDTYNVPPEKNFDIGFRFDNSGAGRFESGEVSIFDFTSSVTGFDAEAFKSTNNGEPPAWGAIHYAPSNGIGDSGKSGGGPQAPVDPVPLPASAAGMLIAVAGLALTRFRMAI